MTVSLVQAQQNNLDQVVQVAPVALTPVVTMSGPGDGGGGGGEKSARSVFVGNIPYEATEEKLKRDLF